MSSEEYPMKTRATLRREYELSVPLGGEHAAFAAECAVLETAQARLREARARRVELARRAAEHKRKLHDWKGKVPRARGAQPPLRAPEVQAPGMRLGMPFVRVAALEQPTRAAREKGSAALRFGEGYVRAMEGIEGFGKAWLIGLAPVDMVVVGAVGETACWPSGQGGLCMHLVLVDIVERRGRSRLDKDVLIVNGIDAQAILEQEGEFLILDIKPYLSYCEAFPAVVRGLTGPSDGKVSSASRCDAEEGNLVAD